MPLFDQFQLQPHHTNHCVALCSPRVPQKDKDMMYYLQKHGENLEADPPVYGCLHPKWQKQHKDKSLSVEEWSLLWQAEMCAMKPINPKPSHHMTSLDKWTVSTFTICISSSAQSYGSLVSTGCLGTALK